MDVSSLSTKALRAELRLRQIQSVPRISQRRSERASPFELHDASDDDSLFVPERPSGFGDARLSQSREQSIPRQSSSSRTALGRKRRRSQSREKFNSITTREVPRLTESNFKRQHREHGRIVGFKSKADQEEQDRQLAERLQAEDDDILIFTQGQWMKTHLGTQARPIVLDRDSSLFRSSHTKSSVKAKAREGTEPSKSRYAPGEHHDAAIACQLAKEEAQAQEERLRQAATRTRDCSVCSDITLLIELPSLASCSHKAEVCADCYTMWIGSQLEASGWQEVKCPSTGCKVNLAYEEIKAYASKETFEKYDKFMVRQVLSADPNFRWCRAGNCLSGQIHDAEEVGNVFACVECHARFCTVHAGVYHDNETCAEYEYRTSGQKERDERKKEEEASEEAVGKLTKNCPGSNCGWPIEKNGGCSHMSCESCSSYVGKFRELTTYRPQVQTPVLLEVSEEVAYV